MSSSAATHELEKSTYQGEETYADWDGPHDPQNPQNWSFRHRWAATVVVSLFTFMSPLASSMIAPALPQVAEEFSLEPGSVLEAMSLSVFVLAYAIGPLLLGPLSEIYGRRPVLQGSNFFFLAFNVACSRAQTSSQLLAFRFLAGLGGSAPLAIGGGTIADLWAPEERGMAMGLYSLAPLTGPAIGPIVGAWIAQKTTWRWVFYSTSIANGIVQALGFWYLAETYEPTLLAAKARLLMKSTRDDTLRTTHEAKQGDISTRSSLGSSLMRAIMFLCFDPVMTTMATYMAVIYGLLYLQLTTFAMVWSTQYGQSVGVSGLHYLFMGAGFTIGGQVGARLMHNIYHHLKKRNNGVATPEMWLPLLAIGSFWVPVGLLIYGWTAQYRVFWLVPDVGVFIFTIGTMGCYLCIQTYIVDAYGIHAASAVAALSAFRSIAGFAFPLFANKMFATLGLGWGNSVLGLIALVIGCPTPFLFYWFGPQLRALSRSNRAPT
ncbi:MFS general substrate transporter [Ceratobasidium sp. AG-I]|nr:MFS general substrate transporter [Ceratobasidium sp. AG-I]